MSDAAAEIISVLRANKDMLRARGVLHAAIFGSVARGEARPDSDLDVMVQIDPAKGISVYDFVDMRASLSIMLGRPVDLVEQSALKALVRAEAMKECLDAF